MDWFTGYAKDNFERQLTKFRGQPNLNYLQIGAYKGDASYWLFKRVLTDPTCRLTDIDCWDLQPIGTYMKGSTQELLEIERTYDEKIAPYKDRISKNKTLSKEWLLNNRSEQYDFIYIDGNHNPQATMVDGVLAWDLLKVGGIIAFDDYLWDHPFGEHFNPKPAIDMFMHMYRNESQIILNNWQVWLRKI